MLKSGDQARYIEYVERLQHEVKQLVKGIVSMVYFMRGSISYHEMMNMSAGERDIVSDFLDDRLESEKKNPYPVY